jgi:hypothetical protein
MKVAASLCLLAVTTLAHADEQRVIGFGSAMGGGFSGAPNAVQPVFMLPTIEAQIFVTRREDAIELTVPILNNIAESVINRGFEFNADLFFTFNFALTRGIRYFVGPGLGLIVESLPKTIGKTMVQTSTGGAFRIPWEVGVEALAFHRHLGFRVLARPWIEIDAGDFQQGVSAGFVGMFGISIYGVRRR